MTLPSRDPLVDMSGRTLLGNSLLFARALRARGVPTDLAGAIDFGRALTIVEIGDRTQVHAAGAAIFVRRHDDLAVYDEVFSEFWRRHELRIPPAPVEVGEPRPRAPRDRDLAAVESRPEAPEEGRRGLRGRADPTSEDAEPESGEAVAVSPRAWSAIEVLRHREFERMTAAELREAERLIDLIRPHLEARRTRRSELHRHGTLLAPRAMLRRNLKTGGDLVDWVWRRPARRPRSIVVICDVSGSMERHSRLMLRFVHAIFRSPAIRAEAFVFGTHLTRITRDLRAKDPDLALARISESVTDWSGGTRIGDSFREFNLRWARRVLSTSGIVVVLSDGWDRGDPAIVRDETARLQRSCHRLVWIDPLAGGPEPRPLAPGIVAAYASIDDFVPVQDLASLELFGEVLAGLHGDRPGRPDRRGRPRVHRVDRARHAGRRRAWTERDALRALRGATAAPLDGRGIGGSVPRTIA